jgi:hypothetical protein
MVYSTWKSIQHIELSFIVVAFSGVLKKFSKENPIFFQRKMGLGATFIG